MMNTRKIIQALTYLAYKQPDKQLVNRKAFKLLWLADKYQLRNTGRTITGDTYYALPHGLVPSDAKHILEKKSTTLPNDEGYFNQYILLCGKSTYKAITEPDCDEFSDSDIEALDKVLEAYGNLSAKELSEFSHQFPEWLEYRSLIEDKKKKNSHQVNIDLFFEPCETDSKGLFAQSNELLSLTKELYHQYNRN